MKGGKVRSGGKRSVGTPRQRPTKRRGGSVPYGDRSLSFSEGNLERVI